MQESQSHIYEFGDFRVDATKRLLLQHDGESVPLTPKVFDTLLYLVAHSGKILDKDELMSAIWADTIVEENNLSQNISILRRILGEKRGEHRFIATIPGRGFKFVAEVSDLSEAVLPQAGNLNRAKFQTENQSEINQDQSPKTEAQKPNRFWLSAVFGAVFIGLSLLGFYSWRGNTNQSSNAPIKTVAVLPFKPLV